MNKYKIVLEYAGTRFSGWQEQKNAETIAGELRKAVESLAGPIEELVGAGRTDAGVHALAQVAHLVLERTLDPLTFLDDLNSRLPSDIHVLELAAAAPRFHARHSAISRSYVYQIARRRTAFAKKYVWWVQRELDLARMRQALALVVGEHDFAAFCEKARDRRTTRVRVDRAELGESGALILLRFEASNFLWRMVRRLTGALVEVGARDMDLDGFAALLGGEASSTEKDPPAKWTAPPSGLFLERVRYEGDAPLAPLAPPFLVR